MRLVKNIYMAIWSNRTRFLDSILKTFNLFCWSIAVEMSSLKCRMQPRPFVKWSSSMRLFFDKNLIRSESSPLMVSGSVTRTWAWGFSDNSKNFFETLDTFKRRSSVATKEKILIKISFGRKEIICLETFPFSNGILSTIWIKSTLKLRKKT